MNTTTYRKTTMELLNVSNNFLTNITTKSRATAHSVFASVLTVAPWRKATAGSVTLYYKKDVLDFDNVTIFDQPPFKFNSTTGVDMNIVYNADSIPHAVVATKGEGVTLSILDGANFDNVTSEDTESLTFASDTVGQALQLNDTVVVRADSGAVFKIGNAVEGETSVTFDYAQLH